MLQLRVGSNPADFNWFQSNTGNKFTYFGTPDLRMTAENIAGCVGPEPMTLASSVDRLLNSCVLPLSSGSAIRGRNANLCPISPLLGNKENHTITLYKNWISLCLYLKISITTKPIQFSFAVQLLIGQEKVLTILVLVTETLFFLLFF